MKVEKVKKEEKKEKGKGKNKQTSSFRHRAKAAKKLGYDEETCKSMARAASQKVAEQIDNGTLKET